MPPRTGLAGRWRWILCGAGTVGLAVIVVGTFLPWLGSGSAQRNSYAAGGAVRRLVTVSSPVHDLLAGWPLIGVVAALAVAAAVLGHPVVGLGLAVLVAAVTGTCAAVVLPVHGNRYAHVITTGPITALIGAMLVALTGLITLGAVLARRPQ
jgi:hypothetical protein